MGLKNWYEANIMPRLITCACSQRQVMKRRSAVVPLAYVNSLPPTKGIPAAVKNCIFGEGVSVTAMIMGRQAK